MKMRLPSVLVGSALLCASAACRDSSGPRPPLSACTATASNATDLTLAPGGVAVLSGSQLACVRVPSTTAAADYVFVVTDVDTKLDVLQGYTFNAQSLAAADVGSAALVARATLVDGGAAAAPAASYATEREASIRTYERTHLRGPSLALSSGTGATGLRANVVAAATAVPVVGDTMQYRVPSTDLKADACVTYDSIKAVVKYVGTSSIIAQDVNAPANGFTATDFQAVANEFDTKIYATDVSYFGNPSDIDQNGKVVLLFTPLINKATPKNSTSFFAGFFFAGDLFPRTKTSTSSGCKESNLAELFYLLVPDPTGAFGDPRSVNTVRQITRGTVAHEFQHMINAGVRLPNPNAAFEETWLDEGLAHFAEEAVGRDERGFGDLQALNFSDVSAVSTDYAAFFDQNLRRFKDWLQHPDTSSGPSAHADANLSSRGAAWALVRYSADRFSGGDVRGFTRRLVAGPETGIANLAARAGTTYETILTGYQVANYADDLPITGLDPRFTYTSWVMRNAVAGASGGSYPLLVTPISASGTTSSGKMRSGAAAYFRWNPTSSAPALAVRLLDGTGSTAATWTGARLVVLRAN